MGKIGGIHGIASRRVSDLNHLLFEAYSHKYPVPIADVNRDIQFTKREYPESHLLAPLSYTMVVVAGVLLEEYCPEKGTEGMHSWASSGYNSTSEEIYYLIINLEPLVEETESSSGHGVIPKVRDDPVWLWVVGAVD